jgi:hypothetical protein
VIIFEHVTKRYPGGTVAGGAVLVVLLALAVLLLSALARRLAVPAGLRTQPPRSQ